MTEEEKIKLGGLIWDYGWENFDENSAGLKCEETKKAVIDYVESLLTSKEI